MAGITTTELQALTPADNGRRPTHGHGAFGIVRVGAKGISVQFSLRYRLAGTVREIRLGAFPKSSLREIRDVRDGARSQVNGREDPLEHKRIERLKKQAQIDIDVRNLEAKLARRTFRQRFNEWVDSAFRSARTRARKSSAHLKRTCFPLSATSQRRMFAAPTSIRHLIRSSREVPIGSPTTLTDLQQFMKWCQVVKYVSVDPLLTVVKKDVGGSDGERERTLSNDEIRALPSAPESANLLETTKHVLMLILATNARVGEVIKARKHDINLELKIWRIPLDNSKNRDVHVVFLSDFALEHMRVPIGLSKSKEWLLPGLRREDEADTARVSGRLTRVVITRNVSSHGRPTAAHDFHRFASVANACCP